MNAVPDLQTRIRPAYLDLTRKEARLRPDQVDAITALTRRINRGRRPSAGPGIADNTRIPVAVDLLLAHLGRLAGGTAVELLTSALQAADTDCRRRVDQEREHYQQCLDDVLDEHRRHVALFGEAAVPGAGR